MRAERERERERECVRARARARAGLSKIRCNCMQLQRNLTNHNEMLSRLGYRDMKLWSMEYQKLLTLANLKGLIYSECLKLDIYIIH
jgi:hypothetical protein